LQIGKNSAFWRAALMSDTTHDPQPTIRQALTEEGRRLVRCQLQFDLYESRLENERRDAETARAKSGIREERRKRLMELLKGLHSAAKQTQSRIGDTANGATSLKDRWQFLRAAFSRRPATALAAWIHQATAHLSDAITPLDAETLKSLSGEVIIPTGELPGVLHPRSIEREDDTPQLLIDVSEVCQHDAGTGIQRVVRAIFWQFLRRPPAGYRVVLIRRTLIGDWRVARAYTKAVLGQTIDLTPDPLVPIGPGDIYLGLDLTCAIGEPRLRAGLDDFRARGARLVSVVYDLLPANHPEWFPDHVIPEYSGWLDTVTGTMDAAIAISAAVAADLGDWIRERQPESQLRIGHFHLGADLEESLPARLTPSQNALPAPGPDVPNFLMVGTVEPRKGHQQTLDAFEILWRRDSPARLIIVGRYGWNLEALSDRLRTHPERGRRLHWLEDASDLELLSAYSLATVLLAPSFGEGFGLPLIEGARHSLPILARDLPVFREIADDAATYFTSDTPAELADVLESWIANGSRTPATFAWQTWEQSAQQLWSEIERLRSNPV
jgi:glycosyltransferase involved in cell wall biosynthesis